MEGLGARQNQGQLLDLERNHLVWLAPAPANNTWVIAVRRDVAAG